MSPLITAMARRLVVGTRAIVVVGPSAQSGQGALDWLAADIDAAIVDVSLGYRTDSYPVLEALIARGLPFALATGHGREGSSRNIARAPTLMKPYRICDVSPSSRPTAGCKPRHGIRS